MCSLAAANVRMVNHKVYEIVEHKGSIRCFPDIKVKKGWFGYDKTQNYEEGSLELEAQRTLAMAKEKLQGLPRPEEKGVGWVARYEERDGKVYKVMQNGWHQIMIYGVTADQPDLPLRKQAQRWREQNPKEVAGPFLVPDEKGYVNMPFYEEEHLPTNGTKLYPTGNMFQIRDKDGKHMMEKFKLGSIELENQRRMAMKFAEKHPVDSKRKKDPKPEPKKDDVQKDGLSEGAVTGIVIAVLLAVAGLALGIYFACSRKSPEHDVEQGYRQA